ncbi:hypothetical protein DVS77_15740 [Mycolicibacterium moriokaense]|nr:hypothetical protein DVS77_15740 [Mycolicibacterium moriokaense]
MPPPGPVVIPLAPLNGTVAVGTATLTPTPDGGLRVQTNTSGLVPNSPHAQHIHGEQTGRDFVCPLPDADTNGDGLISVAEGLPSYGPIDIALTTSGDTTPDSGLALDRFPTADATGHLVYDRTLSPGELPDGVIAQLANLTVVQHGIDVDGNGRYNLDTRIGESTFAQSKGLQGVPAEAVFPANCGVAPGAAANSPTGGVASGDGSTVTGS